MINTIIPILNNFYFNVILVSMQKYIERMITEKNDLSGKIKRAESAVLNPPYGSDKHGLSLLAEQIEIMKSYEQKLEERIEYERGKHN